MFAPFYLIEFYSGQSASVFTALNAHAARFIGCNLLQGKVWFGGIVIKSSRKGIGE